MGINKLISLFGMRVNKISTLEEQRLFFNNQIGVCNKLISLYNNYDFHSINNYTEGLVFSKDRPLQLYALLKSYLENVNNRVKLTVLFKASDKLIYNDYQRLFENFGSENFEFIEESNFYDQVRGWAKLNNSDRLFFLTDDAIFIDKMDISDALKCDPVKELFCFRFGEDLDYCFAYDKKQIVPLFESLSNADCENLVSWRWSLENDNDWGYPLSVDGHIFLKKELIIILDGIEFKNPNSLEVNLQVFNQFFNSKKGVSYTNVKMINVPCNLTQHVVKNRTTGFFTVDYLLEVWRSGKEINIKDFSGLKPRNAMEWKYTFVDRQI